MGLFVLVTCVSILIGSYKSPSRTQAGGRTCISALRKGPWGRTWDGSVCPTLISVAFLLVAFLVGYFEQKHQPRP